MKKILFFIFLPLFAYSQEVITDTVYIEKQGNLYYIVSITTFSDSTGNINKQLLGDSLQALQTFVYDAEKQVNAIAIYAAKIITGGKYKKRVQYFSNLHQQVSGKSIYVSTAKRDSINMVGNWTLVFNGENILGEIQLNNANRFIFNPDNGKVYSISTNLLLSTFTNQISFAFNGVRYDLYKFANGKFATVDNDVRLIKKE
jgi:hypothetical protein